MTKPDVRRDPGPSRRFLPSQAVEAVPDFLRLNADVLERGRREMGDLHMAYFYNGPTLMGAWDVGFNNDGREGVAANATCRRTATTPGSPTS